MIPRRKTVRWRSRLRNDSFLSAAARHQSRGDPRERVLPRRRMLPERLFGAELGHRSLALINTREVRPRRGGVCSLPILVAASPRLARLTREDEVSELRIVGVLFCALATSQRIARWLLNADETVPNVPPEPFVTAPLLIRGCFVTYSSLIGFVKWTGVGSEGINDCKGNWGWIDKRIKRDCSMCNRLRWNDNETLIDIAWSSASNMSVDINIPLVHGTDKRDDVKIIWLLLQFIKVLLEKIENFLFD